MFYLDEIKWRTGEDESYFHPEMVFDLRSLPDCGTPGLTAGRFVLCEGAVAPPGTMAIGEPGFALTPGRRAGLEAWVGESIVATEVGAALEEIIYNLGDPSHVARWKPPSVGVGRTLEFWSNGNRLFRKRVNVGDPEWRQTIASKRIAYAGWRAEALAAAQALAGAGRTWVQVLAHRANQSMDATDRVLHRLGDPQQHLKNLGYLVRLYGVDYHEFIGSEPDEGVHDPATTLGDTFVDTAATSLDAHTASGANGGFAWTETLGTELLIGAGGVTVQAAVSATGTEARAESDLSSSAHYSQIQITGNLGATPLNNNFNAMGRHSASARDFIRYINRRADTTTHRMNKVTGGTATAIGTTGDEAGLTLPYVIKLECTAADALSGYVDGVLKHGPNTDATHNGNVRAGFGFSWIGDAADSVEGDNWEAADLAAATFDLDRIERRTMRGHLRGVMRGT